MFHLAEAAERFAAACQTFPFVKEVQAVDNKLVVAVDDAEAHNPELMRHLVQAGALIQFGGELRHSLEDVYLQVVKDAA